MSLSNRPSFSIAASKRLAPLTRPGAGISSGTLTTDCSATAKPTPPRIAARNDSASLAHDFKKESNRQRLDVIIEE